MQKETLYKYDFVTCESRRWVSALAFPFPTGVTSTVGILQSVRVDSPGVKKCRNKINTCIEY